MAVIKDTAEQVIIYSKAQNSESFVVEAGAGVGKTHTIEQIVRRKASSEYRMLYLAFNTHIVEEAKKKMSDVEGLVISTVHSFAYNELGHLYRHKLGEMNLREYMTALSSSSFKTAEYVRNTVNCYIGSSDHDMLIKHVPKEVRKEYRDLTLKNARSIWKQMIDLHSPVKMPHDGYLKLFCSGPDGIAALDSFAGLIVDESQDQNGCFVELEKRYLSEGNQLIKVGDTDQQLYSFRGVCNANAEFRKIIPTYTLSKSFRFGPSVGELATAVISTKKSEFPSKITGTESLTTLIHPPGTKLKGKRTILHRTAVGVLTTALEMYKHGMKFHVVGGIKAYVTKELHWYQLLKQGKTDKIPHWFLKSFPNWQKVMECNKAKADQEVTRVVKMLTNCEKQGYTDVSSLFELLDSSQPSIDEAQFVLSTVHRFKGAESDCVVLSNDFQPWQRITKMPKSKRDEEVNNLYVALTRVRKELVINDTIWDIMVQTKTTELCTRHRSVYAA
ncbi:ATP-dependent helicase [Vibrio coralliilyticus]|uniref:UvrD-like helicase C-terminal domain-containing protein n=1 Tax=Vibrio coralliilyticus TaxID=190893 RepID=A0AAN0SHF2_9VIBR|nr:UvrD-helicase domain-containing protein [Vibrio coralliilyticus]AIW22639.1 hypothetical protein IX92_26625 [Vibrio coralliilyticus]NOH36733.1 ATP-dependent helicase [Vibrio coralliilyticus]PAW02255.1 ATP-dependent helicase [Vibrio coralliilyticus]